MRIYVLKNGDVPVRYVKNHQRQNPIAVYRAKSPVKLELYTQMLHVWYIYLQNWVTLFRQMMGFIYRHHGSPVGYRNHGNLYRNPIRWLGKAPKGSPLNILNRESKKGI